MPELPEVETVRRGLEPALLGRRFGRVELRRSGLRWPFPRGMRRRLSGARVDRLRRRSKYLLFDLDTGETLMAHLGMSGRLLLVGGSGRRGLAEFHRPAGVLPAHDHVALWLEGGGGVVFNDARRFGMMDLFPSSGEASHRLLRGLGPEPLGNGFHGGYLFGRLSRSGASVKAALLDQRLVAGLGNIYACESLWRAGISPLRVSRDVSAGESEGLAGAIRGVLREAIDAGGSSLRDHRRADGGLGYFQHSFSVYGREGGPCPRPGCAGSVSRLVQSGRSSFHCPSCQS